MPSQPLESARCAVAVAWKIELPATDGLGCGKIAAMPAEKITITCADGACPAHVFHPAGAGPWPAVLFYMDGIGMRPALHTMAERLASAGYYVLLPDLFYRAGAYEPADAKQIFSDEATRTAWFARMSPTASVAKVMQDTPRFLDHLAAQASVRQPKIGVTGYCMGGRMALCAAGHFPDRIAAVASYHPSNLVTDAPDSPHLLAPRIKARVYVGGASQDRYFPDEHKHALAQALAAAGVEHTIETYPARHGWVPTDTPVHDPAAAERHWQTLLDLLARTLA
jgi:carboxymethylenebutenolidase